MVERISWSPQFDIGIEVIDAQHRKIVDYINMLADMDDSSTQSTEMKDLLHLLLDYTYSHFAFEEALMEEAGYEFFIDHQKSHLAFKDKVDELLRIFQTGENVSEQVGEMLKNWLIHHIQDDDQSYASTVKEQFDNIEKKYPNSWVDSAEQHYFK